MIKAVAFELVDHSAPLYKELLQLRHDILRAPLGLKFSEEECARENTDLHLAAFIGATLVGCVVLTPYGDGVMKMRQVAVAANRQGLGIGKKLVLEAELICRSHNIRTIVLNARDKVVPFYLKLGYRIVSEIFIEVSIPHLKMEKIL